MCRCVALVLITTLLSASGTLVPCDHSVDCQNTDWSGGSASCWCGGSQFAYQMQCKSCPNPSDKSIMCGCYSSLLLGATKCGQGMCIASECPQGQFMWVAAMKDYSEVLYIVNDHLGVLIPDVESKGLEWRAECRPCTCSLNQKMKTSCSTTIYNSEPVCETCPGGFTCNGQLDSQFTCAKGFYCADGISRECKPETALYCPDRGMSAPRVGCFAGSFYSENLCTPCAPGSYLAATALHTTTACTLCAAGTRQPGTDRTLADGCIDCSVGSYSSEAGSTACIGCETGSYQQNQGGTRCFICVPGSYSQRVDEPCTPCAPGTYSSLPKSTGCTECAAGTYSSAWAQGECIGCGQDKSTCLWDSEGFVDGCVGKSSPSDCRFCERGFVVCDRLVGDTCISQNCMLCPAGMYCPGGNVRLPWSPLRLGYFKVHEGNATHDREMRVCSPPCAHGFYERRACDLETDTDCQLCQKAAPLQTYVSTPCGALSDAQTSPCPDTAPGGICNLCLDGAILLDGRCVPCAVGACQTCADGFTMGPGSALCTRKCGVGEIATDGAACHSRTSAAVRDVAWTTRLQSTSGAARFNDKSMLVANNRGSTGLLWQVALGEVWLTAADTVFGEITGLIAHNDGFLLSDRGSNGEGRIRSLNAIMDVTTVAMAPAAIGGIAALADGLILFTSENSVWITGNSIRRLRGTSARSTGFADTRGFFSRPTDIAMHGQDTVVVLDDFGVWTFGLSVIGSTATTGVCGGGGQTSIDVGGTRCSAMLLNDIMSMTTGTVRGRGSVVFATPSKVAYFEMDNLWVYLLASAPIDTAYGHVFWGPALYVTAHNVNKGLVVIEIGLDDCLCDAGLYCLDGDCVQAPVGTFAPSWSQAPIPCKAGTVSTGAGKHNRSEGCAVCAGQTLGYINKFTTHFDGAINCEPICASDKFFNSQTGLCVGGCLPGQYLSAVGVCTTSAWGADANQQPCAVGTRAIAAGICEPCPEGTTTRFEAADRCMGPLDCVDGGVSCLEDSTSIADITSVAGAGFAGSASGLWFNGALLFSQPYTFGLLALSDDESIVYSAGVGGHCVWQFVGGVLTVLVGKCQNAGTADGPQAYALFSSIQSLAHMHVEGETAVLFVGSEASGCGSIRAISLFDASVTTFASYDDTRGNRVVFTKCFANTLGLAVARGSNALYYFGDDGGMTETRNDGIYAQRQVLQTRRIRSACAKQSLFAFSDGDTLAIVRDDNPGYIQELSGKGGQAIGCSAGQRFLVARGQQVATVMVPGAGACVGGYVMMNGNCMQLGVGQYSLPDGSPAPCKGGTYGTRAGAWSHSMCKECPSGTIAGEGALTCQRCPSNRPLARIDTCVSSCPRGFYRQSLSCVACPAGMDSLANGLSLSDCKPCAAGRYANASSNGVCVACPAGWSSLAGSHHCVVVCAPGQCSKRDGQACIALTENWEMLTSVQLKGRAMRALTVGRNGMVFFSDGNSISYFRDDCPSNASDVAKSVLCQKAGTMLLASGSDPLLVDLAISSLAITRNFIDAELTQRHLYATSTSTHSIYRLLVTFAENSVSIEQSWPVFVGAGRAGFADGIAALFDTPTELELSSDGKLLYVSDYGNNRIRIVDTATRLTTTLLGNGMPCWRFGSLGVGGSQAKLPAEYCNNYEGSATAQRPLGIGLSRDNSKLYTAMLSEDAVGLVSLREATLSRFCSFLPALVKNTFETCRTTNVPNSRSCFLWKPYDVAATDQSLFVAVTNGVTRINLNDLSCEQVSGSLWNWNASSSMGYADGERVNQTCTTSRVYNPFKLVFAADTGILYVADLSNGAVRRIFIDGKCSCPEGSIFLEEARACYDPTQRWGNRVLVQCEAGQFAMEGDTACRSCDDAAIQGLFIASCAVWAERQQVASTPPKGFPFSRVVGSPGSTGDWFGVSPVFDSSLYDDIVHNANMFYVLRPSQSEAKTLRYQPATNEWMVELDPNLQATDRLPGLWYPCGSVNQFTKTCMCSNVEALLGGPWAKAREDAMRFGGRYLATDDYLKFAKGEAAVEIWGWSRFMLLANVMHHYQERVPTTPLLRPMRRYELSAGGPVGDLQCYVGWPAQSVCPPGFVWPAGPKALCLSCLPGSFSAPIASRKQVYECELCFRGQYSAEVASSACSVCPSGTYATGLGGLGCTACDDNHFTVPGAQAESQCNPCDPGTGSCSSCIPGQMQHQAAQPSCDYCPRGHFSSSFNATRCSPCAVGFFQALTGMVTCEACRRGTYAPNEGSSVCLACTASCILAVDGICGRGCGLNRYWDDAAAGCATCVSGTLNTDNTCALDATDCWAPAAGKFYNGSAVLDCPIGTSANPTFSGCTQCEAGTRFQNGMGCVPCAGGQFSTGLGLSTCEYCGAGSFTPLLDYTPSDHISLFGHNTGSQGFTACILCPAGQRGEGGICHSCRAGTYSFLQGSSVCSKCVAGTYGADVGSSGPCTLHCEASLSLFSGEGSSACSYCVGGLVANDSCVPCGLGMYGKDQFCQHCALGLVNLHEPYATNSSSCQRCMRATDYAALDHASCVKTPPGFMANAEGTGGIACAAGQYRGANDTACQPCATGYFAAAEASVACVACGLGKYASDPGQTVCHTCSVGAVADRLASQACRQCDVGYIAGKSGTLCDPCPNNTFGTSSRCERCDELTPYAPAGATVCIPCPDWTVMRLGTCQSCAAGRYMVQSDTGFFCRDCPSGTMTARAGAWQASQCEKCLGGFVVSASKDSCVTCPAGQQKSGETCADCPKGTASSVSSARCEACSAGSYSPGSGASACLLCPEGESSNGTGATACQKCAIGQYAGVKGLTKCLACDGQHFATSMGSVTCQGRRWACAEGEYVAVHSDKPEQDNECAPCKPCGNNEFMVTAQALQEISLLCPGNLTAPAYKCISNDPEAGYYFLGNPGATAGFTVTKLQCPTLVSTRMQYVAGNIPGCYVGCMYGVKSVDAYNSLFWGQSDDPFNNVFVPGALQIQDATCAVCPTTTCRLGMYRPASSNPGCGPPCETATGCGDGCIGECRDPPMGADTTGGSSLAGSDRCPWACGAGWYMADDEASCLSCAEAVCDNGFVLVERECFPWTKRVDICKPCEPMAGARPKGWDIATQQCLYECLGGYFSLDNACVACSVDNDKECAPGHFRDYFGCMERGLPPLCRPCIFPSEHVLDRYDYSFATNGGFNASNCTALCDVGFHSLQRQVYIEKAVNVFELQCVRCNFDNITCHGVCQAGQFRNTQIANGLQGGACGQCLKSHECGAGQYAPACSGNSSSNVGCLQCSEDLLYDAMGMRVWDFVPYSLRGSLFIFPLVGDCPRVCRVNHILSAAGVCTLCSSLMPMQEPAFVFAHWNATPGIAWWPAAYTPHSMLPLETGIRMERAGRCWACPYGEGTVDGDADLCILLPGFGRAVELNKMTRVRVPVMGSDVYLSLQEPAMPYIKLDFSRRLLAVAPNATLILPRRRLLVNATPILPLLQMQVMNVPCQVGYYKPGRGQSCYSCPYGTSTVGVGAVRLGECVCLPGYASRGPVGCSICPPDTYSRQGTCIACAANETTFGRQGNTACSCRWGLMRTKIQTCEPCPANSYCRPCMQGEWCPSNRVALNACFLGAVSPPGSTSIQNCTCQSGLVALKQGSRFYCSQVPPMAVYDAALQRIACTAGWTETWVDGQLLSCTLCGVGRFASLPVYPTLHCTLCPAGAYADTADVIGNCTRCPPPLFTARVGSTSIADCGCLPPTVASSTGGCVGCRMDQYSENGVCKTCPLYSMGKAGGSDCQCIPGYAMTSAMVCVRCAVGSFSAFAGSRVCSPCPRGSTTTDSGSSSIRQCTVCLGAYVWMDKMGCVARGLLI